MARGNPSRFDLDPGWIHAAPGQPARRRTAPAQAPPRLAVGEVLKAVAEVAGGSVGDVKQSEMLPGANPARRLAVCVSAAPWRLRREQPRERSRHGNPGTSGDEGT